MNLCHRCLKPTHDGACDVNAGFFGHDKHTPVRPTERILKLTADGEVFDLIEHRGRKVWRRLLATPRTQVIETLNIFGVHDVVPLVDDDDVGMPG